MYVILYIYKIYIQNIGKSIIYIQDYSITAPETQINCIHLESYQLNTITPDK